MHAPRSPQSSSRWRRLSVIFLSLLPLLALFHAVMWFAFTSTLFQQKTGDLKRMGYLVGLEDCKAKLVAQEPTSGFTLINGSELAQAQEVPTLFFGDSFEVSLAKAYSLRTGKAVGVVAPKWEEGQGLAQIEAWIADDWFRQHGVRTIVLERVEYAWLDTFADPGEPALDISWSRELEGGLPSGYAKAAPWSFANNGNFKVILCNFAYLFSPTAFKQTDTTMVPLREKLFDCSYGNKLLFYRGEKAGALTDGNHARLDAALHHLQGLSDLCHAHGLRFQLVVPPVKSYLYYDWVVKPFYPDSKMLEALQDRATPFGYVDLKRRFHAELEAGHRDLYYPDDAHWNFPAAEIAAEELTREDKAP